MCRRAVYRAYVRPSTFERVTNLPNGSSRVHRRVVLGAGAVVAAGVLGAASSACAAGGPSESDVRPVADRAMDGFEQGWRTGIWAPFLDTLAAEFSFWFPEGQWRGRREGAEGRAAIEAWTRFHTDNGNRIASTRTGTWVSGDRVFYAYEGRGASPLTEGYNNWELIVLTIGGSRVSAMHEYWGNTPPTLDGLPMEAQAPAG